MKKQPKQPLLLNQILFPYGSSAIILSSKTEIPVERLEEMFAQGDSTEFEMELVAKALERPIDTIKQAFNCQSGNFNQNGSNQRQKVNVSDRQLIIKAKKIQVFIQVTSPSSKPAAEDPNNLAERLQQLDDSHLLLGDQSYQVGRSLTSGTHGF